MKDTNEVLHLRVLSIITRLPESGHNEVKGKGSIVFLNNPSFNATFMDNRMFRINRTYRNYYMDRRVQRRLFSMTQILNANDMRKDHYRKAKDSFPNIRTPQVFDGDKGDNSYIDMSIHNRLYNQAIIKTKMNLKKRIFEYISYMRDVIYDERWDHYTRRTMMIDMDAWGGVYDKIVGKDAYLTSPWMMFYYLIWRDIDLLRTLGDIDIIMYNKGSYFRLNPLEVQKDDRVKFEQVLKRMSKYNVPDNIEQVIANYNATPEFGNKDIRYATGQKVDVDKVNEEIKKTTEYKKEASKEENGPKIKIVDGGPTPEIDALIDNMAREGKGALNHRMTKRDEVLREKQKEIQKEFYEKNGGTLIRDNPIEVNDVSESVDTTNPNITQIRYDNFNKAHNNLTMNEDIISVFSNLNNAQIPVYIHSMEMEDSSDELNAKSTMRFVLEDANRVRHTVRFDIPTIIDDKFLYLNGNKKVINKQLMLKPVVKTHADEVQVVSNYNKIFIRRQGNKLSKKTEMLRKVIAGNPVGVRVKLGSSDKKNIQYLTTIEYDELSKTYSEIKIGQLHLMFDQESVQEIIQKNKIKVPEGQLCIGFDKDKPVMVDHKKQLIVTDNDDEHMDIVDLIVSRAPKKFQEDFHSTKTGKVFMYSEAMIMRKRVPIILLLGYLEGLTTVLHKANIKHYFTDKRPKLGIDEEYIQFSDGYLVYDKHPVENSLLMNGMTKVATKGIPYSDMDKRDTYIDIFDVLYNQRNIGNAFLNFYDFMIDPVTLEVLQDLSYPTDFVNLIIFASNLLADSSYVNENDMALYRIRSTEKIYALLYREIARSYGTYRQTAYNNNPKKISMKQSSLLDSILTESTVEDYSTLNPVVELEKSRAASTKGPSGLNLSQAYTLDKRGYDPTMLGIIGISTSPDANVGIARQLTMEPKITNPRGYIEVTDDPESLKDVNLFSPAELLTPLGVSRDDSSRTAMAVKQSKHAVPVKSGTAALITNGADQVIQYQLSSDFAVTAEHDGEVVKVDEDASIAIIKYGDNYHKALDLSDRLMNNSAGGFYLENPLVMKFKEGQKFKKNDIIAYSDTFFKDDVEGNNRFKVGSLQKIAIMGSALTYEDATFITEKMSRDMATDVIISRDIVLGKNSNVENLVSIGDEIQVGDELLNFDESFEDESVNNLLLTLGEQLGEDLESLGKRPITSKESGTVVDIRVYSTVDIEELSPSLQKIVRSYYRRVNKRKRVMSSVSPIKNHGDYLTKFGYLETEPTSKIETEDYKIKGNIVGEGVLIQVFVKTEDIMGVGDKLAYFTALKSIVSDVVPKGYEPYTLNEPDEEISSFIAPAAIAARMTPSIVITLLGNKVLVNLKKQLQEIFES